MDYLRIIKRDLSNLLRDTPVEVANCEILWHINNLDDYLLSMQSKTVWTCHNIMVSAEFGVLIHLPYIWRWFYLLKTIKRMVCHLVCFSFFHTWFHLILTIKRIVCYFVCLLTFHTFEDEIIFLSLSKEWCAICCAFPHFTYLKLISSSFDYEKNCVLFDVLTHLTYIWRWYHHLKTFKIMVCYLVCFLPFTYLKIISSSFDY